MREKESCYARLMLHLYQSIDSIHVHNKLYSDQEPMYYYGYRSNSFQKGDHYFMGGGVTMITHHDRYGDRGWGGGVVMLKLNWLPFSNV